MVQMESEVKSSGINSPEIHRVGTSLDMHTQPEKKTKYKANRFKGKRSFKNQTKVRTGRARLRCQVNTQISKHIV